MKKRITLNLDLGDTQQAKIYQRIKALGKSEAGGLLTLLLEFLEKDDQLQRIEEQLARLSNQQVQALDLLKSLLSASSGIPSRVEGVSSKDELSSSSPEDYDLSEIGRYGFSM